MRWLLPCLAPLAVLALLPCPAPSCSYCSSVQQTPTFRQEAGQPFAKVILFGTLHDKGNSTELQITDVLRNDPALGDKKAIPLSHYQPADPKNPPRYLVFADVDKDKFDTYRGVPITTDAGLDYVKKTLKLDSKDRINNLLFYFNFLENDDAAVATDAFLELAKATDKEIGQVAGKLSAEKLRGFLKKEKTPLFRLGLYAFMLGGCGTEEDATYLAGLLKDTPKRIVDDSYNGYDGILGGYIHLKPKEGWELAAAILKDGQKPFQQRLTVVRALQFYHGWQPAESRPHVVKALGAMLQQGELADIAIEDLRRWEMWDLTRDVLAVYGKKGYDGPIVKATVVRYALCCKDDKDAANFVAARRRAEPEMVKDVEESLKYDK